MFQLTTSRRGRRHDAGTMILRIKFQLTTSRRGRLHVRIICAVKQIVSTHDLTKRSTKTACWNIYATAFQLTTSRRGRRSAIYGICGVGSSFQLTTSRRGRRNHAFSGTLRTRFNSRPHEEVDPYIHVDCKHILCFNSRPHEEVDKFQYCRFL